MYIPFLCHNGNKHMQVQHHEPSICCSSWSIRMLRPWCRRPGASPLYGTAKNMIKSMIFSFVRGSYLVFCFNHFRGFWKTILVVALSMGLGSVANHNFVTWERQFHPFKVHKARLIIDYRYEIYSLQILLSRTQAGSGRTVKQEQE